MDIHQFRGFKAAAMLPSVRALRGAGGGQPRALANDGGLSSLLTKDPAKVRQGYDTLGRVHAGLPGTLKGASAQSELRARHAYYVRNRNEILAKKRAYRAQHHAEISRQQRRYRRQLQYGRKKRQRISMGGHAYMYGGYV